MLKIDPLEASILGGAVSGRVTARPLAEGMPVSVALELRGVDLAMFTKTIEPPNIEVNGLADGTLSVEFNAEGLQDYVFEVHATEDFSINREALLMLVENALSVPVLGKSILQSIGKAAQRRFGHAELSMRQGEDRIIFTGLLADTDPKIRKKLELPITIEILGNEKDLLEILNIEQLENLEGIDFKTGNGVQ